MATRLLSSACPLRLRPLVRRHPAPQHCRTPQRQALARHVGLALMDVARVTLVLLSRHASKAVDVPAEQVGVVTVPMCVNFDGLQDVLKYANTVSPSPPLPPLPPPPPPPPHFRWLGAADGSWHNRAHRCQVLHADPTGVVPFYLQVEVAGSFQGSSELACTLSSGFKVPGTFQVVTN